MAIRPPKYNSQGFTLIEMVATVMVAGILMAIAAPSLLSLNKPLRDGSLQFKSQLSLIRSKAISSSKAYRIRPKFTALNDYPDRVARNFVVEYAGNCRVTTSGGTDGWQMASQFDLDLPPNIGIPSAYTGLPTVTTIPTNPLNWGITIDGSENGKGICFDNRGLADNLTTKIILKDFQGFNKAKIVVFDITKVGGIDVSTYSESPPSTFAITGSQGYPEF